MTSDGAELDRPFLVRSHPSPPLTSEPSSQHTSPPMVASPASSEWADVVFYVNTDLPTEHERNEVSPPSSPPSLTPRSLFRPKLARSSSHLALGHLQIIKSLLSRGAKQCPPSPPARGNRFDVDAVTIVISHTSNFPEYDEIMEWNKKMIKLGNGEERKERKWVVTVSREEEGRGGGRGGELELTSCAFWSGRVGPLG